MFEGGSLMSFQQLQRKYNLPTHDLYKYLQMRHYLQKHKEWENIQMPPSNIENFFLSVIKGNITTKFISYIYKILQEEVITDTKDIKGKWELEMNIIINDEDWEKMFREGHRISNSPMLREFEWKIKIWFFRTPLLISRFNHTSDKCWRGCGLIGDFTHIFWDCPKLSTYWKGIQKEINNCLCITIPLEPSFIILGIFQNKIQDHSKTYILKILFSQRKWLRSHGWSLSPQRFPNGRIEWGRFIIWNKLRQNFRWKVISL